ncbi:MAG: hypothetical protein ACQESC_02440 [Nanobdellota archaeon]
MSSKKLFIPLLLFVFVILIAVNSFAVSITDSWFSFEDEFTHDGSTYTIQAIGVEDDGSDDPFSDGLVRILKRQNNNTIDNALISFGDCDETAYRRWCFENASFDREKVDIDSKGRLQPAIHLDLDRFEYEDKLDISRTFEQTEFTLGEKSEIALTIENDGDIPLYNITVSELIPEGFMVLGYDNSFTFNPETNKLTFIRNLYPTSSATKMYTIKAIEYGSWSTQTHANYTVKNVSTFSESSSTTTLSVPAPFTIEQSIPKNEFDKDERMVYDLTIENNEDEPLSIASLHIDAHPNTIPVSYGDLEKKDSDFTFEGEIPPFESKTFDIRFKLPFVGAYDISYDLNMMVKEQSYTEADTLSFQVGVKNVTADISFCNDTLIAGMPCWYTVTLKNTAQEPFYNLTMASTFLSNTTTYTRDVIPTGYSSMVVNNTFIVPFSFQPQTYFYTANTTYRTNTNQWFEQQLSNEISSIVPKQPIDIIVTASNYTVSRGDRVRVNVSINNTLSTSFNQVILVNETLPENISYEGDISRKLSSIEQNNLVRLYSYSFTVPEDIADKKISLPRIVTMGSLSAKSTLENKTTITIRDPVEEGVSYSSSQESSTTAETSNNLSPDPEDMGFFKKLVYLIRSIF